MNIKETKNSLQKLIIRLEDAEKGFVEISKATIIPEVKAMVDLSARERKHMRSELEFHLLDLGGEPKDGSSFAANVHRAWIDIKVNGWGDSFEQIVDEIETGSTVLIDEYQIVLEKTNMNPTLRLLMTRQQESIILQLNKLRQYRDSLMQIEA